MPANHRFEELVRERTEALLQTNERLWSEILQRWGVEEELRESENRLHHLSSQLLNYQELERKRVARELHDGLSQCLIAIKLSFENGLAEDLFGPGTEQAAPVGGLLERIQSAIDELHRITTNLYPSMLDDLGIIPTISWCCREIQAHNNNIHLKTYIDIPECEIPSHLKPVIYRVLQEALNNITQHSKAKHASVHLNQSDSGIEIMVRDDGVGFDAARQVQSESEFKETGIMSMRWRTSLSGGSLAIIAARDAGTTIRAVWSLRQ